MRDLRAEENSIDSYGRLKRLHVGDGWLDIRTDVRIPALGWKEYLSLGSAARPGTELENGKQTWAPSLSNSAGLSFDVEQTIHSSREKIVFDVTVTSKTDKPIEAVYFFIDCGEDQFAGGAFMIGRHVGELPVRSTDSAILSETYTNKFMFVDSAAKMWASMTLSRPSWVLVKDQRKYGENFSAFVSLHTGALDKGESTQLQIVIEPSGVTDDVAQATLKGEVRYPFRGFGGNYAFAIDSPVARYTLDNLHVSVARTAMTLAEWEPEKNLNEPPKADWNALVKNDQPGSHLRREFELMQELNRRKIPYVSSIWSLPAWMYEQPPKDKDADGNKFSEKMWPEVLECIGSYLLYAKEKYQAEPEYLSFNEPDLGIKVKFSAEEHRGAIKRIGEKLNELGLKTTLLLGDVSNARETFAYARTAADRPEFLKYVGAIAFHTWGGAAPEQYAAWGELADKLKSQLFVTEAGVDPFAWHDGRFQDFDYGVREMIQYQKILLQTRPQTILFWEYSDDYSLLAHSKEKDGGFVLTPRFCFQKQFADLTPPGSVALSTYTDRPTVLFTAFQHLPDNNGVPGYTFHLANQLWARKLTIHGIPRDIERLNVVHTTRDDSFKELSPVTVHDGKIELDLPAQSLTTLTTLAIPKLKPPE